MLIIGAIVIGLLGAVRSKMDNLSEGVTILITLIIVCALDAWTSKSCEDGIQQLLDKHTIQKVKVIRDGKICEPVEAQELVVGDVYLIEPGILVPADSILIECTEEGEG